VTKLRWYLFKKNQREAEKLPPTRGALQQHILRAHFQTIIWFNADVANPEYGWKKVDDQLVPIVSDVSPAPSAVVELVNCGCGISRRVTGTCFCKKQGLACTECVYVKQILPSATTSITLLTHLSQTKMMMMTMTAIVMNKTSL
jgi:hypothetical protein